VAGAAQSTADEPGWNWKSLLLFFLAGVGLTFTPCVLPMLPILSGVVLRGQVGGLRGLALSLAYVLPMAASFAALGALMGLFGAGLNLQARLQSAWVLVPFALFFAVFALAMFGLFELKLPQALSNRLNNVANHTRGGSLLGRRCSACSPACWSRPVCRRRWPAPCCTSAPAAMPWAARSSCSPWAWAWAPPCC
jgi:Thiol:disulfide interchange protein